jgi:hypothetical protein
MTSNQKSIESVLLIGEASGVHRNLAKGLRLLGVDVKHMVQSDAPSWKWYDDVFAHNKPGWRGGVARNLEPFLNISRLDHFDVINFTNTITSVHGIYTRYFDLPMLQYKAGILAYYALGCDEVGLIRRNSTLPYSPCEGCLKYDQTLGGDCKNLLNPRWEKSNRTVEKYFDFGASSMMEYDHTSVLFEKEAFARISLPVDISNIAFTPAKLKLRPLVLHTPTRRGFKGTKFVLEAIDILKRARDDFDFLVIEGLSYDEYVNSIRDADIIIDQIFSQSPGMNGLEMLAAGKIVMTGATDIGRSFVPEMAKMPAFDASPDPETLARDLGAILDRKSEFPELALAGRDYVTKVHDPIRIAKIFLDHWQRQLDSKREWAA